MEKPLTQTAAASDDEAHVARRRAERARKKASAPFFLGRQILLFMAICIVVIAIDVFLYIGIAIYENNLSFGGGSPKSVTRDIGLELALQDDGTYGISEGIAASMDAEQCWAMLISEDGEILWNRRAPDEVLHPYTLSDVAVFSRIGYLDDYPCFVWQRDDGLVVTGFPKDSYAMNVIGYLPQQSMVNWPAYALLIFFVDAAVLFLAYAVSKRRVEKSIAPVVEALDELACGRPAHVRLKGSLRDIGESINAADAIMRRKDEARKRWVTGVSHDIRTPLAISMGHAENIEQNEGAPDEVRESARIIVRQNARIRDLVSDLNIASKLEYDMQPIDVQPVRIARMVRGIAADYANTYAESPFSIEADVAEDALSVEAAFDARLVDRALRNLVNNAIRHNEDGCTVRLFAERRADAVVLGVQDDGAGMQQAAIARLNQEASEIARMTRIEASSVAAGPTPPPHFGEWRPDEAARLVAAGKLAPAEATTAETGDSAQAAPPAEKRETDPQEDGGASIDLSAKDLTGMNEHGLGLSLVARIAVAHGGSAQFAGGESKGFRAAIVLPLVETTQTAECDEAAQNDAGGA